MNRIYRIIKKNPVCPVYPVRKILKSKTHKEQAEILRKDLQTFLYSERQVRDLLLYYTPPSTLQKHQRVIQEIKIWFDNGTFTLNGKDYIFSSSLLKEALKALRSQSGFTPPGNESTGYLKKTMRTLLERKEQQRKAAGVDIVPLIRSTKQSLQDVDEETFSQSYFRHRLAELEAVKEIDVSEIRATLQDALETGTVSNGFFESLTLHLMETVREQIGTEWECLHKEVEGWFVEYKDIWNADVLNKAIETGFRQRLNERYGVPLWR